MAKIEYVDFENLSDAVVKELKEFAGNVEKIMADTCEEGIKESKKKIVEELTTMQRGKRDKKDDSKGKHYRSTFTTRKKNNLSRTLWNRQYPLSHLIEDGHFVYNQFGGAYSIHPTVEKRGRWITGSKYGTSGYKTKAFKVWDKTEKHISKFVEDTLDKKLK